MTLQQVFDLIQTGGVLMTLLIFIWAGMTRRIVYGWAFTELRQERDRWRELALKGTALAGQLTNLVTQPRDEL